MAKKQKNRDIQIYTAGTVTLPPNYPEVGILAVSVTGLKDPVLSVEHRMAPNQLTRYILRRDDVSAIVIAKDGKLDPKNDEWLLGDAARSRELNEPENDYLYGIVYVREDVGVIMQVERGISAGEVHEIGSVCEEKDGGCCCEEC
jgi:hypothetical protein